jgi:pyruvate formate lyase activating enzyme
MSDMPGPTADQPDAVELPDAGPRWTPAQFGVPAGARVECVLCPLHCRLAEGQTGACQVRRNVGGTLLTATFATSTRHLDAIERKPLFHFRPGSVTLTLSAPGCTFRCDYCVNFRASQYGRDEDASLWAAEPADPDELVAAAAERSASICLSYTEPALAAELTLALAERGRDRGVDVLWKSNGFLTPTAAARLAPALAAVNIDLKGVDDAAHRRLTGAPVGPVIDTIRAFRDQGVWVEVSTPLIPGVSAEGDQLARIADTLAAISPSLPWHLVRFTPAFRMADQLPTSPADLAAAVTLGHDSGLHHVYVERALGDEGRGTHCPACGNLVVSRGLWSTRRNTLNEGRCPDCGTDVEGRW